MDWKIIPIFAVLFLFLIQSAQAREPRTMREFPFGADDYIMYARTFLPSITMPSLKVVDLTISGVLYANETHITNTTVIDVNVTRNMTILDTVIARWFNGSWNGSDDYVPYTGATQSVDLGSFNLTIDTNVLFVDEDTNRVGIGQITGFDPRTGLSVTGDIDLTHTATESDDHAMEIIVDAAGFGDVKGVVVDYITGTISAGKAEEAILINIDESSATGGDVIGLEILTTEGSAVIYGLKAGALVSPVVQLSGTFTNMDSALVKGVDNLNNFTSTTLNESIFVADNDNVTIGNAAKFEEIEFLLETTASNPGIKPTFEYSNGTGVWVAFSPTDGTGGMRNTGVIAWDDSDIPDWSTGTGSEYLIRITRTQNNLVTIPMESKVQIASTTKYEWDRNGNLIINGIRTSGNITPDTNNTYSIGNSTNYFGQGFFNILNAVSGYLRNLNIYGLLTVGGTTINAFDGSIVTTSSATFKNGGTTVGVISADASNNLEIENNVNGGDIEFVTTNADVKATRFVGDTLGIEAGGAYPLVLSNNEYLGSAARTITIVSGDANRTVTLSGNPTIADWFDQCTKTTCSPTFIGPTVSNIILNFATQDYNLTHRSELYPAFQGLSSGTQSSFEYFNKDGDASDNINFIAWARGTPTSVTNREFLQTGYIAGASPYMQILSGVGGSGVLRPLILFTSGNTNQLKLRTDGGIIMAGVYDDDIGAQRAVLMNSTGDLGYDSSSLMYKENVRNMTDEMSSKIYQLRPITYDKIDGPKNQIGLGAEEVNELFPEFISYKREPVMGTCIDSIDNTTYECVKSYRLAINETTREPIPETVNYRKMVVPLIQEVQNLKQENDMLKSELCSRDAGYSWCGVKP